jgi:hypothetical protein
MKCKKRFVGMVATALAACLCWSGCGGDDVVPPQNPTIELLSPVGGEVLQGVSDITWRVNDGAGETVSILLSDDSGATYSLTLANGVAAGDDYAWDTDTAASPDGTTYRIRVDLVSVAKTRVATDASGADFTVDNSP